MSIAIWYREGMARIEAEQIFVYSGVVDLRKGPDSLRALVGHAEPEACYVFSNRARDLLKFLSVDETGQWCGTRRLHHQRFAWPESPGGRERLTAAELAWLLSGGDVRRLRQKNLLKNV